MRLTALLLAAAASSAAATDMISSQKLQSHIVTQKLQSNLWNLNKIANDNGGNRAFGLPGYKASVDFVLQRVRRFSPIESYTQEFTEWFTQTLAISLAVEGEDIAVGTFSGTVSTPNKAVLTAPLALVPEDDVIGSGCDLSTYDGLDATGKIVLVKRGVCPFGTKAIVAKSAGAAGVLIYNNVADTVSGGNLGKGDFAPVGMISLADGLALIARLEAAGGEAVTADLLIDAIGEDRKTWNVIAETKGGDPNNVIVLGAHLDSVQAGAGINDDGSGTTALLEIIEAVKHYGTKQKIRFIWWGAEENGKLGSYHYTDTLPPSEVDKIALYMNFDMIGSPNAFYGVFDGDGSTHGFYPAAGSGHIEKQFADYLEGHGKTVQPAAFTNGTDYVGFIDIGVPVGGLFTGTVPQDMCYHQKCDNIDNINWDVLTLNTKAIAHVLAGYAMSLKGIPDRSQRTARRAVMDIRGAKRQTKHDHPVGILCSDHDAFM